MLQNKPDTLTYPTPDCEWTTSITPVDNAIIEPPTEVRKIQPGGVYRSGGEYMHLGSMWRDRVQTLRPSEVIPTPTMELSGTWLWGGVWYEHFGHFLMETLSRIWAVHSVHEPIQGIIWIKKSPRLSDTPIRYQTDLLEAFGFSGEIFFAKSITRVARLLVPGPGLGIGKISRGTTVFHNMTSSHFGKNIQADGASRIYVSRVGLGVISSGVLGEVFIEKQLIKDGYAVVRPETLSISQQIAAYKAADQAIIMDGSAAHLCAMTPSAKRHLALILRRRHFNGPIIEHINGFSAHPPLIIDTLKHLFNMPGERGMRENYWAVLDFSSLGEKLYQAGLISTPDLFIGGEADALAELAHVSSHAPIAAISPEKLRPY